MAALSSDSMADLVCKYAQVAIETGADIAVAPLTAMLAPEIGPLAPIVAEGIVWVAQHTAGGLANFLCKERSYQKNIFNTGLGELLKEAKLKKSQMALAEHGKDMKPMRTIVPAPSAGAHALAAQVTSGVPSIPTFPIVSGKTPTGFTPQPIQRSHIGIETWPRMDSPAARRYYHWDRYQSTWNGQPNATYPKVGF